MKKLTLLLSISLTITNHGFSQYNYPITRRVDSSDTYFGITYPDPYRWLENLKDSNVVNWFYRQKIFTDKTMANLDGADSLLNQLQN